MSSKPPRGFTLIEMIIAIVIIGVGLAGVLSAFTGTVKSSADPMIRKQMLSIAEGMLEEILLKPYTDPTGSGTITGCDRSQAKDISAYSSYTNQPVCDIDGTPVAGLAGYTVTVTQADVTVGTLTAPARKISVQVKRGTDSLTLVGWRTNYAVPSS
jgi:MSHA pilin protein MshD